MIYWRLRRLLRRPSAASGWRASFFWLTAFFAAAWLAAPVHGAPAFKDEYRPSGPTCFLNKSAAGLNAARLSGAVLLGAPAPPAPRVLVIRVDFMDEPMTASQSDSEAFFARVREYYLENSYGVFQPTFTVTASVHRLGSLATYGADCGGDIACHDAQLRADAVTAENTAGRDFSTFNHVMIYHAGHGQETTGNGNDIWSVYFPGLFVTDATSFDGFTVVPEKESGSIDPLGVICHEYGHQIGLPDLYDTSVNGGRSTVGAWDIMDYPYTAAPGGLLGANPPHFGAWSKAFLQFTTPSTWTIVGAASLTSANVTPAVIKIPLATADEPSTEYLLLEYRRTTSTSTFDHGLPGSGLLVWHIDDAIASNPTRLTNNDVNTPSFSGKMHRGVDLVEADFTEAYGSGQRAGQRTDAFDSGRNVLPPSSNAFNGVPSGVALTSVSGVGTDDVGVFIEPPTPATFSFTGATPFTLMSAAGTLTVQLGEGAFASGTVVFGSSYTSTTLFALGAASAAGTLTPTGVGFALSAQANRAPAGPISASFSYAGLPPLAALGADEAARLTFARYVPARNIWVPIETRVDPPAQTLTARLDQLSIIQVMVAAPGGSPSDVRVFPNPIRPSLGFSYQTMNFSNVPADAQLRVFTAAGELVRELRSNNAGQASWDGRNAGGNDAASGLYLVVIEDPSGGRRKVAKVAIER